MNVVVVVVVQPSAFTIERCEGSGKLKIIAADRAHSHAPGVVGKLTARASARGIELF